MDKQEIIAELRRVAEQLGAASLTRRQFKQYSRIGVKTVEERFGSWNQAIEAAGLTPNVSGSGYPSRNYLALSEDELLQEIIRLTREIGKQPTLTELSAKGHFSVKPYRARWGSLAEACKVAYAKYGFPLANEGISPGHQLQKPLAPSSAKKKFQRPVNRPRQLLAKRFNMANLWTSEA